MSRIERVRAWSALDSRGRPTVACRIDLTDGAAGTALVPSGASAGSHEALELRDGGSRHRGRGVDRAVGHVRGELAAVVHGLDVTGGSGEVDAALLAADGSPGLSRLGANAVLAVSLAAVRAAAASAGVPLARLLQPTGPLLVPMPMVNVLSGGAHAGGLLDVQDFLVLPLGAESFAQAIEWSTAVRDAAEDIAVGWGHPSGVLAADEGGLGLPLRSNRDGLTLLTQAIELAGLRPGVDAGIALDIAATEFLDGDGYHFRSEGRHLAAAELVDEIAGWCKDFPVVSIEDVLGEDDWAGWTAARAHLDDHVQLIGDDLFVTQVDRLQRGIDTRAADAVLVKVNQNGTVSGAAEVVRAAHAAGFATVVSARSGDTEDTWLADLAVGWRAGQIKVGSTRRSERTAKWNRLSELEALEDTEFAGWSRGRLQASATGRDGQA